MTDSQPGRPSGKVARLLAEWNLEGLGAELETRWTADGVERSSLRDLADLFNRRLLERALVESGGDALDLDTETTYENLTGADASAGVRTDTRRRLERLGVDVEALESAFVSYQAIRTYLKEDRGAEYEGVSEEDRAERDVRTVRRLLSRTRAVVEDRVAATGDRDRYEVLLEAQVLCQRCGSQYPATELIGQGGCDCERGAPDA